MAFVVEYLKKIKNMPLMTDKGVLYILQEFDYRENQLYKRVNWLGREIKKNVSYIASLTFDKYGNVDYSMDERSQALMLRRFYNEIIPDRARYLTLAKNLTAYGYTIKRKTT